MHPVRPGVVDYAATSRDDPGRDWLFYDHWEREFMTEASHRELRASKPVRPRNHPRGYNFHRDDIPCGETRARERAKECDEYSRPVVSLVESGEVVEFEPEWAVEVAASTRGAPRPRQQKMTTLVAQRALLLAMY